MHAIFYALNGYGRTCRHQILCIADTSPGLALFIFSPIFFLSSHVQFKCYMRQLLLELDHWHARGVMHWEIKCTNLLVSNASKLKVAEVLLGATAYEPSVDLWSVDYVFTEMHAWEPIL
ncbi:hypothetical protein GUJ93_ZPchr0001g31550 [Zizania palustris]|uniref:[RNA-polymerase]-subunit kinase n=1 Tax=Zizania palustris TaxID=103762 RepID=A0A8J5S837_ZIZPA|nr:hypothetical protein GUJ93_ZPchr0001g31550 [Zizania palustris]